MRTICLIALTAAFASTGCAAMIAGSGQNLQDLENQAEVHAAFGPPAISGETEGQPFEEFTTRRKIAEPWQSPGMAMLYTMTLGLAEVVFLPVELYHTGRRTLLGQRLRFTYDADGHVTAIQWDGDPVSLPSLPEWRIKQMLDSPPQAASGLPDTHRLSLTGPRVPPSTTVLQFPYLR